MASRFRGGGGILAALGGGAAAIFTATQRSSSTLEADTAFQHHQEVKDFHGTPGYQYVHNFWLPNINPQPAIRDHFNFIRAVGGRNVEENGNIPEFDDTSSGSTLFHHGYSRKISIQEAIRRSRLIMEKHREEIGSPGLVIGVSIDGNIVWTDGVGFADFENRVPCHAESIMRIASIGKAVSMTIVAKLLEQGLLDLDKPIQEYLPDFPMKTFDGKRVTITCRQLVSHLSGIRHYSKTKKSDEEDSTKPPLAVFTKPNNQTQTKPTPTPRYNEFEEPEYHLQTFFKTTAESVALFKDDPLLANPGDEFLYTTHGWTLLCAVIEAVTKRQLTDVLKDLFRDLNMTNTVLDEHETIVYNRSRNYRRDKIGRLKNAPYIDNSYKWAGGGLLSSVGDLLKFAHLLMFSYQSKDSIPGYLKSATMKEMWSLVDKTRKNEYAENGYGMGWMVVPERKLGLWCLQQPHLVYHTGGAIGASSVLAIIPRNTPPDETVMDGCEPRPPQGIVVTLIANLERVSLYKKSLEIAQIFDQVDMRSSAAN